MKTSKEVGALVETATELQIHGDWQLSEDLLEEAGRRMEEVRGRADEPHIRLGWFSAVTTLHMYRNEWANAEEVARGMLRIVPQPTPAVLRQWEGNALSNLMTICAETGRLLEADELGRRALALFRDYPEDTFEHLEQLATALLNMAVAAARASDEERARTLASEALEIARGAGLMRPEATALRLLGTIAAEGGQAAQARELLEQAEAVFARLGADMEAVRTGIVLAHLDFMAGDLAGFEARLQAQRVAFRERGEQLLCAQVDFVHAHYMAAFVPADFSRREADLDWSGVTPHTDPSTLTHEHRIDVALQDALQRVLPAALALDAMRVQFPSGYQREQFAARAADPARNLAFRLAWQAGDAMLLTNLVTWQAAAGTPTVVGPDVAPHTAGGMAAGVRADIADAEAPIAMMLPSGPSVAIEPMPRLLLMPGGPEVLAHEYAQARERYGVELRSPALVPSWTDSAGSADGADGTAARDTITVTFVDAGDIYGSWRLGAQPGGVNKVVAADADAVLAPLAAALPSVAAGVNKASAYAALLRDSPLVNAEREAELATTLSRTFVAYNLAVALDAQMTAGKRPHVRVQPSPRTAVVPWELIALDVDVRLVDIADVTVAAPGRAHAPRSDFGPAAAASPAAEGTQAGGVAMVLDPRVPGFPGNSELGSVLGRITDDPADQRSALLLERIGTYAAAGRLDAPAGQPLTTLFRRTDADRAWLSAALLQCPSRLMYVGHVSAATAASGQAEDSAMHLSCRADTPGSAEPMREHRPFTAQDLFAEPERWPMPPRVALIACESGADLRFRDPFGLVGAVVFAGAELVTGTRWPLLTDHALAELAAVQAHPVTDAVLAIDAIHESPDPVAAFGAWQRERLAAWRRTGDLADSPLLWGALVTFTTS